MKKIVSVIMSLYIIVSVLGAFPTMVFAATSGTCGDNLTWTLDDEGTLTISGTGYMSNYLSNYMIPWYYMTDSILNLIIEDGVRNISHDMFINCKNLKSVRMGESVETIDQWAFGNCESLECIVLPNKLQKIERFAFAGCSNVEYIIIPKSLTYVESRAFEGVRPINVYYTGSISDRANIYFEGGSNDPQWGNAPVINATWHYNYIDQSNGAGEGNTDSINLAGTDKMQIIVYENKNDSSKVNDDYRLSVGATVSCSYGDVKTNSKGSVVIATDGSAITISKDGYISHTIYTPEAGTKRKVYLQKDTGNAPIITAVWLDSTDVYHETYYTDITSTEIVTLIAEVVWGNGGKGEIYLMQDGSWVAFSDNSLTMVLSDEFDVSEPIYIVAEDSDGNATKKKLKLEESGGMGIGDYKFTIGDVLSAKVPDDVPIIGGSELKVDVPFIPITVTFEDNKFYGVLGLNYMSGDENDSVKYLFDNIKSDFKKSADSWNVSKLKSKWGESLQNFDVKFGFDGDLTVLGYVEGYVDSNGNVSILDGGVKFNPTLKWKWGSQLLAVPPVYWEATIKGEIGALLDLYTIANSFRPMGSVAGDVTLKGGLGLGVNGVAGISGGAVGNLGLDWDIYLTEPDYLALSGSIGAYANVVAGPITLIDKTWDFKKGLIADNSSSRLEQASLMEVDLYNTADFKLIERDYADNGSEFVANDDGIELFSYNPQNKVETVFKTNVYPYSEPQIAQFSDGTMLAAWLDDDTERSAINRTAVMYSYYDGSEWSEPVQLKNDGTGDFAPNLKVINDVAYITWVNANKVLSDEAETAEIFTSWEIAAAEFDKENAAFIHAVNVTDNDVIDMMPVIYGNETGVEITWVENSSNDIFSETNDYSIMVSEKIEEAEIELFYIEDSDNLGGDHFGGDGWDPEDDLVFDEAVDNIRFWSEGEAHADELMPVANLDGCIVNGERQIAYVVDLDGNQNDYTDKEVFLNNEQLTSNDVLDSNVVFDSGKLYYYSDGAVVQYDLNEGATDVIVNEITTDRFKVISDGVKSAIVYTETDGLVNELYTVIYDAGNDAWGEKIALTQLESGIDSFSGVMDTSGEMKFIVNKTEIVGEITSENPYGQTDISLITVTPEYNLSLDGVFYHEELLMSGNTQEFYCTITNKGELAVNDYKVQVVDADGNVLATTYNEEAILSGQSVEFTAYYPLGDEFVPHDVSLRVMPINAEDFDESDNVVQLSLNCENISLENLGYGIDADGNAVIFGDVVNRGYSELDTITATLRKGGYDGEVVDTFVITEALGTLELAAISFTVPFEDGAVYCVELDCVGENSDFVVLKSEEMVPEDIVSVTIDGATSVYDTINEALQAANQSEVAEIKLLSDVAKEKIDYDCSHVIDLGGFTVNTLIVNGDVKLANGNVAQMDINGIAITENVKVSNSNAVCSGTTGIKSVYTSYNLGVSMIDGAQVRIGGGVAADGTIDAESGLRFIGQANIVDTLAGIVLTEHFADGEYDNNYGIGTAIGAENSDATVYIPAVKWQDETNSIYTTALTGMKSSNFNRNFTAKAYVEYDGVKIISDGVTRSVYAVAAGLLAQSNEEDAEKLVEVLNAYVNQTGIRLAFSDNALTINDKDSGLNGAYSGEAFFNVSETKVEGNVYTVVLTPVGKNTKIDAENFAKYIRINNNNSAINAAVQLSENADGTYTLVFDLKNVK